MNIKIPKDLYSEFVKGSKDLLEEHTTKCARALDIKILQELVEREIPKKVVWNYRSKSNNVVKSLTPHCPKCNELVWRNTNKKYCDDCGQHLDWSE